MASPVEMDALKNEYFLSNKRGLFAKTDDEEALKNDLPLLMHKNFKADHADVDEDNESNVYYSNDGIKHEKLLEFCFNSTFTALKEHFNLDPYKWSHASTLVSKTEAEKILQAIDYILGEDYSKKFESILNNEYVNILGEGLSTFDNRFKKDKSPIYINRDGHNYTVEFNDYCYDREIAESDDGIKCSLRRVRACLLAFLNAEESTWNGEELVLEYTAY